MAEALATVTRLMPTSARDPAARPRPRSQSRRPPRPRKVGLPDPLSQEVPDPEVAQF